MDILKGRWGIFRADEIPVSDGSPAFFEFETEKFKSPALNYFSATKDLACKVKTTRGHGIGPRAIAKYFLPFSRRYESVDGLAFSDRRTLVLFQITLARQHPIKADGIKELLKCLPKTIRKLYVVFVILERCQSDYSRSQNIPDTKALAPYANNPCIQL